MLTGGGGNNGGGMAESPFKFYNASSKAKFVNGIPSNLMESDLSSLLKGGSYLWPGTGNTPLVKGGDMEEKLLDTAKINSLLNESKRFTFEGNNE